MAIHNEIGQRGEALAAQFLEAQKYQILARNWRHRRAEIDLIVQAPEQILVFVEVRTRSNDLFGLPGIDISERKKQLIFDAANAYMESINYQWAIRFDLIGIVLHDSRPPEIAHYEDAFLPGYL